jgi:DNA-binding MarR family transcriptional regulator
VQRALRWLVSSTTAMLRCGALACGESAGDDVADRFEDLRTLLMVISAGGVSAAAAEMGIAKSAVSRRLTDLEKRLGASLIDRSSRRLKLTVVGADYASRARSVMAEIDALDASVAVAEPRRTIVVRGHADVLSYAIAPVLTFTRSSWDQHVPTRTNVCIASSQRVEWSNMTNLATTHCSV